MDNVSVLLVLEEKEMAENFINSTRAAQCPLSCFFKGMMLALHCIGAHNPTRFERRCIPPTIYHWPYLLPESRPEHVAHPILPPSMVWLP